MTKAEYEKQRKDYWQNVRSGYWTVGLFAAFGLMLFAWFALLGLPLLLLAAYLFVDVTLDLIRGVLALFAPPVKVLRERKPELLTFPEEWTHQVRQ